MHRRTNDRDICRKGETRQYEDIEVLHSFWTGNRTESPRNRKSWGQLEKAIKEVVPQDKQEDFTRMIEDHSDSVEYSGFVAGFRIAAKLWREL